MGVREAQTRSEGTVIRGGLGAGLGGWERVWTAGTGHWAAEGLLVFHVAAEPWRRGLS